MDGSAVIFGGRHARIQNKAEDATTIFVSVQIRHPELAPFYGAGEGSKIEILRRGVYPEPLRFTQGDRKRRTPQDDARRSERLPIFCIFAALSGYRIQPG